MRAAPHRQRRAPVALARERPVDVVRQPVAEAAVLDVRRVPGHGLVGAPAARRAASSWRCTTRSSRSRAAACRSASSGGRSARMPRARSSSPRSLRSSISSLRELRVLDEAPLVASGRRGCARAGRRCRPGGPGCSSVCGSIGLEDPRRRRHAVVVLAEGRREVHDAGAVLGGDEVVGQDREVRRQRRSLKIGPS